MKQAYSERVKRIIRFCEMLTVPDGMLAGQMVALSDEQKRFINAVYGPRTPHGLRIVRDGILTMARKNAKTALIAMLALVHLCGPEAILNGELYSVAFEQDQAAQVFRYMSSMIYASPALCTRLNVVDTQKLIRDPVSGSFNKALSRESRGKLGKSTSFLIFDEGAQYGRDRRLLDAMITSMSAHAAPLRIYISTQAENDAAWFSELVDYGKEINSGEKTDPSFVAFIYEVPPKADSLRSWLLVHLATLYDNRADLVTGTITASMPRDHARGLLDRWTVRGSLMRSHNSSIMRQHVTLHELTLTANIYGEEIETWCDASELNASVEPLQGREYFRAGGLPQRLAEVDTMVRIRYRKGLRPLKLSCLIMTEA